MSTTLKDAAAAERREVLTEDYKPIQEAKRFLLFYVKDGALAYDAYCGLSVNKTIADKFGRFLSEDCDWLRDFLLNAPPGAVVSKLARGFAVVREY